jgi:uncharacterized damage-inducible protein DinB
MNRGASLLTAPVNPNTESLPLPSVQAEELMKADLIQALARYNLDANRILMNAAAQLSEEEFSNTPSPSRESVKGLLLHLFMVEAAYDARCRGNPFKIDRDALNTFREIQQFADQTAHDLQEFMASLTEEDFDRVVTAPFGDQTLRLALWQMLLHTFMHTARHRGELSMILSQLGHPLPIPDLIVQFVDQSGQTWPFERA